jgi:Holliday junction resolvase RusA-like endonuclease
VADLFTIDGGAAAQAAAPLLVVELPGPPKAKGRHRSRVVLPKQGKPFVHNYADPETAKYEEALGWAAKAAMRGRVPFDFAVAVRIFATLPIPKSWTQRQKDAAVTGTVFAKSRPDWDNYGKTASDAFNGIVWLDDSQVVCGLVVKRYGAEPSLAVEVYRV